MVALNADGKWSNTLTKTEEVAIKEMVILLSRKDCTKAFTLLNKRLHPFMISCKNIRNICQSR